MGKNPDNGGGGGVCKPQLLTSHNHWMSPKINITVSLVIQTLEI